MNVNDVASVLAKEETWGVMKEFTLGKSPMNVNSVASVLWMDFTKTIIPLSLMASESGLMGYGLRAHSGSRNNC